MVGAYGEKSGRGLKKENVIDTLIIAEKTNDMELKKKRIKYISEEKVEIDKNQHGPNALSWDLAIEIANYG